MIEIIDGDVVVIRDGELVEAVYYRKFYHDVSELIDQVIEYLNDKKFALPNLSFMRLESSHFVQAPCDSEFYAEFADFARIFNFPTCVCKECKSLQFIFLDTRKTFCPTCKTSSLISF